MIKWNNWTSWTHIYLRRWHKRKTKPTSRGIEATWFRFAMDQRSTDGVFKSSLVSNTISTVETAHSWHHGDWFKYSVNLSGTKQFLRMVKTTIEEQHNKWMVCVAFDVNWVALSNGPSKSAVLHYDKKDTLSGTTLKRRTNLRIKRDYQAKAFESRLENTGITCIMIYVVHDMWLWRRLLGER